MGEQDGVPAALGELQQAQGTQGVQVQRGIQRRVEGDRRRAVDDDLDFVLEALVLLPIHTKMLQAQVSLYGDKLLLSKWEEAIAQGLSQRVEDTGAQKITLQPLFDGEGLAGAPRPGADDEVQPADIREVPEELFRQHFPHQASGAGDEQGLSGEVFRDAGHGCQAPAWPSRSQTLHRICGSAAWVAGRPLGRRAARIRKSPYRIAELRQYILGFPNRARVPCPRSGGQPAMPILDGSVPLRLPLKPPRWPYHQARPSM